MRHAATKRILAIILCLCLVAVYTFSFSLLTAHEHHDCSGENCPICLAIHAVQQALKTLTALAAIAFYWSLRPHALGGRLVFHHFTSKHTRTLQSLGVQFNE